MCWRTITERLTIPIRKGPLAGKRWLIAGRRSFIFGTYEEEQVQAFGEALQPGDIVFDIGAHWGYFTLLASERVGPSGKVFAFEPSPHNLIRLRRHLEVNRCENVQILELAAGGEEGTARFEVRGGSRTARLSEDGGMEVKVVTLDGLIERGEIPPPDVMKIDVEGAEVGLLNGAEKLLASARPRIFLSTHAYAATKEPCVQFMDEHGYVLEPLNGESVDDATDFLCVAREQDP